MSSLYGFCGAAVCFACLAAVIKQLRPDFLPVFTACAAVAVASYVLGMLLPLGKLFSSLAGASSLQSYLTLLIKAVGISLLCGTASDVCKDLGETAIANGIETAGKVAIIVISLPVAQHLIDSAVALV